MTTVYKPYNNSYAGDWEKTLQSLFGNGNRNTAQLPVDVFKNEDLTVLQMDLPGVEEDRLDVRVEDGSLLISVKQESNAEKSDKDYIVRERRSISFERKFSLPRYADAAGINADLNLGVLTVTIPKKEEAKPISVKVKTG